MVQITRPAVEITQGQLKLYLTYVTPRELKEIDDFYTVDKLDAQEREGFQRVLDTSRANRLARNLRAAFPNGYANLPTSVFLATGSQIGFDPDTHQMTFETDNVCPFSVVDGQHRIAGLVQACEKEPGLLDFQLPTTIAVSLDDVHQMLHFYVVNISQKAIDQSVAQVITARFTEMHGVDQLPYLPDWLERNVAKGTDELALDLITFLNGSPRSPLQGRNQLANEKKEPYHRFRQSSFATAMKRHIFTGTNPIFEQERNRPNAINRIMLNFFCAVDAILVGADQREKTRLYNSNGIYFLAQISKWVFQEIYVNSDLTFSEDSIKQVILWAFEILSEGPNAGLTHSDWWLPPNTESSINRATADGFADAFREALRVSRQSKMENKPI